MKVERKRNTDEIPFQMKERYKKLEKKEINEIYQTK